VRELGEHVDASADDAYRVDFQGKVTVPPVFMAGVGLLVLPEEEVCKGRAVVASV